MELIFTRNREVFMHLFAMIESLINMKRFNDDHHGIIQNYIHLSSTFFGMISK